MFADKSVRNRSESVASAGYQSVNDNANPSNHMRKNNYYKSRTVGDIGGVRFTDMWEDTLKDALGPSYWMVKSSHMGQMRLLVFARNDIYPAITRSEKGSQATGVAGVATNKGGVAIGIKVWETELCFINSHLAAHQDKCRARNAHYRDIVKGLRMDPYQMDVLTAYHHVFWMGDLNYRLDYGQQAIIPTESPSMDDFKSLVDKVDSGQYGELLPLDQLAKEMEAKRCFYQFNEGEIRFPPTFKTRREPGMEYLPQRSPAWCDRILYRSNLPLKQVKVVDYYCAPDVDSSDHKPVGALFNVPTIWCRAEEVSKVISTLKLVITCIKVSGMPTPGNKRRSSTITSTAPSQQIIFMGPALLSEAHPVSTTVLRLVDVSEGNRVRAGTVNTMSRGVLPLTQAATALAARGVNAPAVTVTVPLEHNGLPAGSLEVTMKMEVPGTHKAKRPSIDLQTVPNRLSTLMRRSIAHIAPLARSSGATENNSIGRRSVGRSDN
eukprot:gene13605-19478_t